MAEDVCSTCKRNVPNLRVARFNCPNCGKTVIIRCENCRANAVVYKCSECKFAGPN